MANPAPNKAPVATKNADPDMPDFSKWTKRQIGFAPYWSPDEGKSFFGKIIAVDMRDPTFVRYQFICLQGELLCGRGPVEGGEEVIVKKGETFSVSVYSQLADEMLFQLQSGISPPTRVQAINKVPTSTPGRKAWQFECKVSPEDDKRLIAAYPAWQKEHAAALPTGEEIRPQLQA